MSVIIRAHFDGKTIVPDAEVDLPAGQPLEIEVRVMPAAAAPSEPPESAAAGGMDITSLPFFGMWADRKDMRDGAKWVRKERQKWSSRLTGTDS